MLWMPTKEWWLQNKAHLPEDIHLNALKSESLAYISCSFLPAYISLKGRVLYKHPFTTNININLVQSSTDSSV